MFYILSLLLYVKARTFQKGLQLTPEPEKDIKNVFLPTGWKPYLWYCSSILAWFFALGSKQIAVTLPFIIFLYEWYFIQNLSMIWIKKSMRYLAGIFLIFFILAFIYMGSAPLEKLTSMTDYANNEFTLAERLLTQPRVVIHYLSLLFYPAPSRLRLDYDFGLSHSLIDPITTLVSLGIIAGLLFAAFRLAGRNRLISFSILWFLGNLVLESSVIPLAIIFEHRTYLPSMLIFLPVVTALYQWIGNKKAVTVLMCLAVLILSIWTYQRNQVWKDDETLYRDCIKKSPQKARPYFLLGMAMDDRDRNYDAILQYQTAIKVKPDYYNAHNNLAMALSKEGRLEEAIKHYQEAIRIEPGFYMAYNNLGNALSRKGLFSEAIGYYTQALKIKPDYLEVYPNMGLSLEKLGRIDEAIGYYHMAININPAYVKAYYYLAVAQLNKGDLQGAAGNLRAALEIDPDYPNLQNLLKMVLMKQNSFYSR